MKVVNINDVLKILHKYGEFLFVTDHLRYMEMQNEIANLPNVTLQPKMGKWIDDKCSVCGKGTEDLIASPEWYRDEEPNFCPFCGVKLLKPQAEMEVQNDK